MKNENIHPTVELKILQPVPGLQHWEELYRIARSLLPTNQAAEEVVIATYRALARHGEPEPNRESIFCVLMGQIRRRRSWLGMVTSLGGLRQRKPHAASSEVTELELLATLPTPQAETLVLVEVCGFDLGAASRILGLRTEQCEREYRAARTRWQDCAAPAPEWRPAHLAIE